MHIGKVHIVGGLTYNCLCFQHLLQIATNGLSSGHSFFSILCHFSFFLNTISSLLLLLCHFFTDFLLLKATCYLKMVKVDVLELWKGLDSQHFLRSFHIVYPSCRFGISENSLAAIHLMSMKITFQTWHLHLMQWNYWQQGSEASNFTSPTQNYEWIEKITLVGMRYWL